MGNKQLAPLAFKPNDPDFILFRRLYQRHSLSIKPKPTLKVESIQAGNNFDIIIHHESFSVITERQSYINLKRKTMNVEIDFTRFCSSQFLLLSLDAWVDKQPLKTNFIRIFDVIKQMADPSRKERLEPIDAIEPQGAFTIPVKPDGELVIQYKYLYVHTLCQNSIHIIKLPLSLDCPFAITCKVLIQINEVMSPTHKIEVQQNEIQVKFQKGYEVPLFMLFFTLSQANKLRTYIYKTLCGGDGYSQEQKYCFMMSMLPEGQNLYDEMSYFNCDDPDPNAESETMETIPWTTITTIKQEGFAKDDHFFSILPISNNRRNIIFFLDQSNSMEGSKIDFAKQALQIFIKSLPPESMFNIYGFGSKWNKLYRELQLISEQTLKNCQDKICQLQGNMGSTFLLGALKDALQQSQEGVWFILTDGRIAEIDDIYQLVRNNQKITVYSLGFGTEFDQNSVEQLAIVGRGNHLFCQNIASLNVSVVELLQQAISPQLQGLSIWNKNQANLTYMWPNPENYYFKQNQHLELGCFLPASVLSEGKVEFEIEIKFEETIPLKTRVEGNLNSAAKGHYMHLYLFSKLLQAILQSGESLEVSSILHPEKQHIFYDFIQMASQYRYFNPLMCFQFGRYIFMQRINLDRLKKCLEDEARKSTLLSTIEKLFPADKTIEQAIFDLQTVADIKFKQESVSMEMGSSFTQANQEYLIKLINLQQMDGSFGKETISLICLVKNPLEYILQRRPAPGSQQIVNGRISQQIPEFLMDQIWPTALTVAYLKLNFKAQRGQWLLIYVKALSFLKTYIKNWQGLLYKARTELINASFS